MSKLTAVFWARGFAAGIPAFTLLFMCLAVGFNNAPSIDSLPRSVANCTTVNLSSLDPVWLKRSTNIFCGIFIGLTAICVIYQIIVIALKLLNVHFIQDHHKYFYWMEVILTNVFMSIFIAIVVGTYLLTWLRSDYRNAFEQHLKNVSTASYETTSTMLWLTFGFSISSIYQMVNLLITVIASKARCSSNREDDATIELQKK